MAAMNLEIMKIELAREILNADNIEVVNKLKKAYDRILKSQVNVEECPPVGYCPSTAEDANARIERAMTQIGGTPSDEVFYNIRSKVQ